MVHQVYLFIDGVHFGIVIKCQDGWYKMEYAAGGASGVTPSNLIVDLLNKTSKAITVRKTPPAGKSYYIGDTNKGLQQIIDFAREESGFHNSDYGLFDNNCRIFCSKLAQFMGVMEQYQ